MPGKKGSTRTLYNAERALSPIRSETRTLLWSIILMSEIKNSNPPPGEGRFRLVFEHAPIGMAIVGIDYRMQKVNPSLCEALGYSQEELLSKTFIEITHPDDVNKDKELADKLFQGDIPSYRLEKRFITKDGRLSWLDLSAFVIRTEQNEPAFGLAMVENITERKRAEEALRTSEERYRSFVVNSSEAIWRLEMEQPVAVSLPVDDQIERIYKFGYLAECNDAMAKLYGWDRAEDIIGKPVGEFIPASHPANVASLRAFVSNNYRLHNTGAIEPDAKGRERYHSSSVIGIAVNGYLLRVWGTQRDDTDRRLAENKLEHSRQELHALAGYLQALREKERVNLARELHDVFGQSLTSLKLDLSQVKKRLGTSDSETATRLNSASELIEKTIAQVKTISTELRPGVLDKFGLAAAIEWQCQEFEHRSGIKVDCRLPQTEAHLSPECSTALFRILQEALANVARHSGAANVWVVLRTDDSEAILSVRDDGRGITAQEISAPNSLGLLGMRERTEMLGGQFTVEGKPGRTLVNVRIPIDLPEHK
jgi:PAS domain S-box-containing protein